MQQIRNPRAQGPEGRPVPGPVRIPDERSEVAELLARYTAALDKRIERSLEAIHRSAVKVMRQVAAEAWRAGGPEAASNARETVLGTIARDDALRALLAHTDERYQALSLRVDQMQRAVRQLAEATREAVRRGNQRAAGAGSASRATADHAEAIERLSRSIEPLAGRVESLTTAVDRQQHRHREDMLRFAERTAGAMSEVQRRLHRILRAESERVRASVQGELQRLEAAMRSETMFEGHAAPGIHRSMTELAERTGNVLATLEARLLGQQRELDALSERTTRSVAHATERLLEGTRLLLARVEALERGAHTSAEALQHQREQLVRFTERAGRGLDELANRIAEGFRLMLARSAADRRAALEALETSVHREVEEVRAALERLGERTGAAVDTLRGDVATDAGRRSPQDALQIVTGLMSRQGGQQLESLEAIRGSLRALLDSVHRSGEQQAAAVERVLRASAGRQEALLDEVLAALRVSMEELSGAASATGHEPSESSADALTTRLRGLEQRLAELSRELVEPARD